MKVQSAGEYEMEYTAEDKCGNETRELRNVLVAREIEAGDNIELTQSGNTVTVSADVCGALDDCSTISDMQEEISGKQVALVAGQNITIQGSTISADDPDLTNYYNKTETDDLLDDKVDKVSGKGLSTNDFTNADKQKLDGLKNYTAGQNVAISSNGEISATDTTYTAGDNITIANGVISADDPDLTNYYTKSETYNKTEVNNLVDGVSDFHVEIVQSLPQTGAERTIYFVPKQGGGYTEYMYLNNQWEEIGDTSIDLSGYYNKTETDDLLDDKVDKVAGKGLSTNDYTNADKDIVDGIATTYATKTELAGKQDTLTAGQNVTISNNTISAADTTYTAGQNVTITNGEISATDTTYSEATDTDLGLVKLNSANGINLNADGQLTVSGQWGEKNGFVYFGKGSEPSVTGDAGNGVLVTEANGLQIGNKMLAVITGAGVNLKVRAAAGATEYQFADNYTNRVILSGFKNGYAALNEAAAKTKTVKILSVLRDGQEVVPSSAPADSTKNIIVTVAESANPDSQATQIRFYGTSGGFSNLVIGQGASNGITNSNSAVVGQNVRNYANLSIVAGGNNYNAGSRSALFGTLNINPVSGNQNVFLAGQGHDTTNGSANVAAVGQYSEIDANTAFAVGNGIGVYDGTGQRSNAMEVTKDGGVILKSPNNTKWKITVDDNGNLTTTAL